MNLISMVFALLGSNLLKYNMEIHQVEPVRVLMWARLWNARGSIHAYQFSQTRVRLFFFCLILCHCREVSILNTMNSEQVLTLL